MAHSNSQLATEFECLLLTKKVVPNSSVAVSQLLVAWYFVFQFYFFDVNQVSCSRVIQKKIKRLLRGKCGNCGNKPCNAPVWQQSRIYCYEIPIKCLGKQCE